MKSILTLTIIGGFVGLTAYAINSNAASTNGEKVQSKIQIQQVATSQKNTGGNYNVDITSLEKDLKSLEEGEFNGKWEEELESKYGEAWDEAMEAKYGEAWDDEFEVKMNAKLNEGTTREDLIKSIESDLNEILNRKEVTVNWEDELESKYGDCFEHLMETKYGHNWDDLFEAELRK